MTAKEMQFSFIKNYIKPTLKKLGYKINGQTWWKNKGIFFTLINLQNYSWNSKDEVDFCFNIGVGITTALHNPQKGIPTVHDLSVYLREGAYLPKNRQEHKFKNNVGYFLTARTNLEEFTNELKIDFEQEILPQLDKLESLEDCIKYFEKYPFWGDNLKRVIKENSL